jgi:endogenous inhibitor of DNA gyrase (YacG/DUF329 family)
MLGAVACDYCDKVLQRPIGEEERHVWARITLDTSVYCPGCSGTKEIQAERRFCSAKCLELWMRSDAYWKWKNEFKDGAAKTARRIRKEHD